MKKIFLFLVTVFFTVALNAQIVSNNELKRWNYVIEAIARVESNYNPKAVSKSRKYVGYLQISPILVQEANSIIGKKHYTLNDRFDIQKSKEMFVLIQRKYNKTNNVEKAIRIWQGGCKGYTSKAALAYYKKVLKYLNQTAYI